MAEMCCSKIQTRCFDPTALRDLNGDYYLNGNWELEDLPSYKEMAGTTFEYQHAETPITVGTGANYNDLDASSEYDKR